MSVYGRIPHKFDQFIIRIVQHLTLGTSCVSRIHALGIYIPRPPAGIDHRFHALYRYPRSILLAKHGVPISVDFFDS